MLKLWEEHKQKINDEKLFGQASQVRGWFLSLTRNPASDWIPMMVKTISYRMAWPTFLLVSVFVATCKGR